MIPRTPILTRTDTLLPYTTICRSVAPVELELHARAQEILSAGLLVVVDERLAPHARSEGEVVASPFAPGHHGPGHRGDQVHLLAVIFGKDVVFEGLGH